MMSGTATAPAYITSTCCRPRAASLILGRRWSTGCRSGGHPWGVSGRRGRHAWSPGGYNCCVTYVPSLTSGWLGLCIRKWEFDGESRDAARVPEAGGCGARIKAWGQGLLRLRRSASARAMTGGAAQVFQRDAFVTLGVGLQHRARAGAVDHAGDAGLRIQPHVGVERVPSAGCPRRRSPGRAAGWRPPAACCRAADAWRWPAAAA